MAENRVQITIVADGRTATEAIRNLNAELGRTDSETRQAGSGMRELSRHTDGAASSLNSLGAIAKTAMGYFAVGQVMEFARSIATTADNVIGLNSRLKIAVGSQEAFNTAQVKSYELSAQAGSGYAAIATLMTRLSQAGAGYGLTQERIAKVTEVTARSLQLSGAAASESSAVIRQLSQALGSGVLRGEEFNSIMENGPRLAKALADGLNVPIGSLRGMAEQGELTTEVVVHAFETQSRVIAAESANMQRTMSMAGSHMSDEFGRMVDAANGWTGAGRGVATMIDYVADHMREMLGGVAVAAAAGLSTAMVRSSQVAAMWAAEMVTAHRTSAAAMIETRTTAVAMAEAELQTALSRRASMAVLGQQVAAERAAIAARENLAAATVALNAAQAETSLVSKGLSAVVSGLGGPIGVVTTLLAAGATAWMVWGDNAETAAGKAKTSAEAAEIAIKRMRDAQKYGVGDLATFKKAVDDAQSVYNTVSSGEEKTVEGYTYTAVDSRAVAAAQANLDHMKTLLKEAEAHALAIDRTGEHAVESATGATKKQIEAYEKYVQTREQSLRKEAQLALEGAKTPEERGKVEAKLNEELKKLHESEAKSFEASQKKQTAELDRAIKERNALYAKQADNTKNTELQYFAGLEKANERAVQIINDRYDDEEKAADRAAEYVRKLQEKELEEQRERSQKFLDSITDATADVFYDMFRNIGSGWSNLWSSMKSWALKILAQIAAQAAATQIVMPVVMAATGTSTTSAAVSALSGGSGTGGIFANLPVGSILSKIPGMSAVSGLLGSVLPGTAISYGGEVASLAAAEAGLTGATGLTLGSALSMGGLGGLGYSFLGGYVGLPQNKYSGITSSLGGMLGAWGGSALASSAAGAALGATAGSVLPVVGTIAGAVLGGLASSLFGSKEHSASVIFQGQNIGWGQTDNFAFHTKDGASNSTGNQIATALEQIAGTAFSSVESLLTSIGGDASSLSSASIRFGRKTGGSWSAWDFGADHDMTQLMQKATADLQAKIYAAAVGSFNAAGQSALTGSTKTSAFALLSSTGQGAYSSIMSSISAGVQGSDIQTYATNVANFNAAMKAVIDTWDAISTSAEQAHRPLTEYQSAFLQINTQFDTWITTLGALGIAQARLDEIEADRAATLEKLTHNLQVSLDAARAQITGGNDAAQMVTLSGTYGTDFSSSSAVQSWVDWFMSATTDQLTARAAQYGVGESQLIQDMVTLAGGVSTAADEFAKLTESLVEYRNELLTSAAGGLTVGQQYVALQAEFDRTSQLASLGDQAAMANLQDVATRYLSASSKFNATASGYQSDANAVLAALDGSASAGASKSGQDLSALKAEIQQLREEQAAANFQLVKWVQQSARIQNRWDNEGMPEVRQ